MEQRISLITLGVKDIATSRKFYEGLGWKVAEKNSDGDIVFFQLLGTAVALFPLTHLLAAQKKSLEKPAPGGITLAYNTRTREEVNQILNLVVKLGGTLLTEAEEAPWGSFTGYFADPDGHSWEVTYFDAVEMKPDGLVIF